MSNLARVPKDGRSSTLFLTNTGVGTARCTVSVAQRSAGATASATFEASFLAAPIPPRLRSAGTSPRLVGVGRRRKRDVPTFKDSVSIPPNDGGQNSSVPSFPPAKGSAGGRGEPTGSVTAWLGGFPRTFYGNQSGDWASSSPVLPPRRPARAPGPAESLAKPQP